MAEFIDADLTQEVVDAKNALQLEADRAKIIVDSWEGFVPQGPGAGTGDMLQVDYDPQGISADVFDRANMTGTQPQSTVDGLINDLASKLADAPIDGNQYARKDGAWDAVTGDVASVNTQTGIVVLDADDISDTATTAKFTSAADIAKLAGIEVGATADQTGAEIKSAYEAQGNTNAYTDAEQAKLAGIEVGAQVNKFDQVDAPVDANEYVRKAGAWVVNTGGAGAGTVSEVNGKTGAVTLITDDIDDSTSINKYLNEAGLIASGAALLPGQAGGQHLFGGTQAGDDLTLDSTSHPTKGDIIVDGTRLLTNIRLTSSTALFDGCFVTKNLSTSTKVDITSGFGHIIDIVTDITKPKSPVVSFAGVVGLVLTNLATSDFTHLYLQLGGTVLQSTVAPTEQLRRNNIYLGKVNHPNRAFATSISNQPECGVNGSNAITDILRYLGPLINYSGNAISANGANMNIDRSAGSVLQDGIGYALDKQRPNSRDLPVSLVTSFIYKNRVSSVGSDGTTIVPTFYDVAGVSTSVPGNSTTSTNQRIYMFNDGSLVIQRGQQIYSTLSDAIAGISTESFVREPDVKDNSILLAILSVTKGAVNLSDPADAKFSSASIFGEISTGTGGSSVSTLQDAYNNSLTPEIILTALGGVFTIQDNAAPLGTKLFEIASNGGGTEYFSVDANGATTSNMVVTGDLTVNGTTTSVNSTNLDVTDKNITVNNGGSDASSEGAGLTVERVGIDGSIVYQDSLASKWKIGSVGSEVEAADVSSAQVLTNKSINAGQLDSGTIPDARIQVSGVTQFNSSMDHNQLLNYNANQHIDWTNTTQSISTTGNLDAGSFTITSPGDVVKSALVRILAPDFATDGKEVNFIVGKAQEVKENGVFGFRLDTNPNDSGLYLTTWGRPASDLYLNTVGNIGLGTFAPTQKLEVIGNIKLSGSLLFPTGTQTTPWVDAPVDGNEYVRKDAAWVQPIPQSGIVGRGSKDGINSIPYISPAGQVPVVNTFDGFVAALDAGRLIIGTIHLVGSHGTAIIPPVYNDVDSLWFTVQEQYNILDDVVSFRLTSQAFLSSVREPGAVWIREISATVDSGWFQQVGPVTP